MHRPTKCVAFALGWARVTIHRDKCDRVSNKAECARHFAFHMIVLNILAMVTTPYVMIAVCWNRPCVEDEPVLMTAGTTLAVTSVNKCEDTHYP